MEAEDEEEEEAREVVKEEAEAGVVEANKQIPPTQSELEKRNQVYSLPLLRAKNAHKNAFVLTNRRKLVRSLAECS